MIDLLFLFLLFSAPFLLYLQRKNKNLLQLCLITGLSTVCFISIEFSSTAKKPSICNISPASSAFKEGARIGDEIVAINGQTVDSVVDILRIFNLDHFTKNETTIQLNSKSQTKLIKIKNINSKPRSIPLTVNFVVNSFDSIDFLCHKAIPQITKGSVTIQNFQPQRQDTLYYSIAGKPVKTVGDARKALVTVPKQTVIPFHAFFNGMDKTYYFDIENDIRNIRYNRFGFFDSGVTILELFMLNPELAPNYEMSGFRLLQIGDTDIYSIDDLNIISEHQRNKKNIYFTFFTAAKSNYQIFFSSYTLKNIGMIRLWPELLIYPEHSNSIFSPLANIASTFTYTLRELPYNLRDLFVHWNKLPKQIYMLDSIFTSSWYFIVYNLGKFLFFYAFLLLILFKMKNGTRKYVLTITATSLLFLCSMFWIPAILF